MVTLPADDADDADVPAAELRAAVLAGEDVGSSRLTAHRRHRRLHAGGPAGACGARRPEARGRRLAGRGEVLWRDVVRGLALQCVYVGVLLAAAWADFTTEDVAT